MYYRSALNFFNFEIWECSQFTLSIQMCTGEKMTIKGAMINPSEPGQQELLPSAIKSNIAKYVI